MIYNKSILKQKKERTMKELKQISLDQTGVAILNVDGTEKVFPLYSNTPTAEADEIASLYLGDVEVKNVFITNNLLDYKIEDCIIDYQKFFNSDILPEDYMGELVSGFPFITGYNSSNFSPAYC